MAETIRQRAQPHGHQGIYLFVAGVLLIVTGLAIAITAVSSAPGNPAPPSVATAAGLLLAIAIMVAGIATTVHRGYWLAEVGWSLTVPSRVASQDPVVTSENMETEP